MDANISLYIVDCERAVQLQIRGLQCPCLSEKDWMLSLSEPVFHTKPSARFCTPYHQILPLACALPKCIMTRRLVVRVIAKSQDLILICWLWCGES